MLFHGAGRRTTTICSVLFRSMDQDAFRALLSTPRAGGSSHASTSNALSGWGVKQRKPTASTSAPTAFKPRANATKKSKAATVTAVDEESGEKEGKKAKVVKEDKYVDRAAARRAGKANEFSGVEGLLESFEARTAGMADQSLIDEQRQYLVRSR